MKQGTTLQNMIWALKGQDEIAADYTLGAPRLSYEMGDALPPAQTKSEALNELLSRVATDFDGNPQITDDFNSPEAAPREPLLVLDGERVLRPNRVFHQQMATQLRIPYDYYKRQFHTHPEDLCRDVTSWLGDTHVVKNVQQPVHGDRTVRSMGNTARAFLSNRYRRLDNYPLLLSVLGRLGDMGVDQGNILSCNVTDKKLYLKIVTPRLEGEVEKGDIAQAGLEVTNSEVGQGSLAVQPLIYRLVCKNGAIMPDTGIRKTHIGGSQAGDEKNGWEIYSDDTMKKADDAFFAQVGDVVEHTLSEEVFNLELDKIRTANSDEIQVEVPKAIEHLSTTYRFSEQEEDQILNNFINGENRTRWGMANAVTLTSQSDDVSYERASELERIGGDIIENILNWTEGN